MHIQKSLLAHSQNSFLWAVQVCDQLDDHRKRDGNGDDRERSAGSTQASVVAHCGKGERRDRKKAQPDRTGNSTPQAGLQSLSAKAAWLSLIGTACTAIPLLLLAQPLLAWFGRDFVAGAPIVTILVLGHVFGAACGPQQHLITMTGHERAGAAILGLCAGVSFVGCILTVHWFGMTGAAVVTTVTLVGWNVAMGIFIHRGLHLMPGLVASLKAMPRRKRAADRGI